MKKESDSKQSQKDDGGTCDFIVKLAQMIERQPEVIRFSEDGKEVIIHDQNIFTKKLLQKYFRHDKWKSFVRQMNMYNFKKINRGVNTYIFVNPQFSKDHQQKYHLIKRKIRNQRVMDQNAEEMRKNFLFKIEENFGENSIHQFFDCVFEVKEEIQESLRQIKKSIENIGKTKKSSETKQITTGVKQTLQIVEQTNCKFEEALQNYIKSGECLADEFGSFHILPDAERTGKSTSLIISQPSHPNVNKTASQQFNDGFSPTANPFGLNMQINNSFGSLSGILNSDD